jgi:hypothetical protein
VQRNTRRHQEIRKAMMMIGVTNKEAIVEQSAAKHQKASGDQESNEDDRSY